MGAFEERLEPVLKERERQRQRETGRKDQGPGKPPGPEKSMKKTEEVLFTYS